MASRLQHYLSMQEASGVPTWKSLLSIPVHVTHRVQRRLSKNSIFDDEDKMGMCSLFPEKKLKKTVELFKPTSVLDLGCGTGQSLDFFHDQGIEVFGVEGSKVAISMANHPEFMRQFDLNEELQLNRKFDLVWSFEFVEHIHPNYLEHLLRSFSNHADRVVISAAKPGQGGEGHFNEQLPAYWIEHFGRYDYRLAEQATEAIQALDEIYSENMLVFER